MENISEAERISKEASKLKYLYNSQHEKYNYMIGRNFLSNRDLQVSYIQNGIIFPSTGYTDNNGMYKYKGGVADIKGNFIENSGLYSTPDHNKLALTLTELPEYSEKDVIFNDEKIVYGGIFIYHWGHFLFECTTRLWYYIKHHCQDQNIKLAIACVSNLPDGNFKEFYTLLGIKKENILFISQPTRFREVIIPEPSSILGHYYTKEFLIPFDQICENVQAETTEKKVYLTRTKLKYNNTIGEESIEKIFINNGFHVISPEQIALKKMVAILKGAEIVAGLCGSNTHNLIFARPRIKAVILNRFGEVNNPQELVHKARFIDATYIDVYSTFLPVTHGGGPFLVSTNENLFQWLRNNKMKCSGYINRLSSEVVVKFLAEWASVNQDEFKSAVLSEHYSIKDCIILISQFFSKGDFQPEEQKKGYFRKFLKMVISHFSVTRLS